MNPRIYKPPMPINVIQERLLATTGDSVFLYAVHIGAKQDIDSCLLMILSQAKDNRPMVARIIGDDLLKEIENL